MLITYEMPYNHLYFLITFFNLNFTHLSFPNTHSTSLDFSFSKKGQLSLVLSLPLIVFTTQILSKIVLNIDVLKYCF